MYAHRRAKLKTKTKHIIILSFILIIYYVTSKKDYCELLYIIHSMLFIFSAKFSSTSCFLIFIFHFLSAFLHIIRSFHISLNENRFFFYKTFVLPSRQHHHFYEFSIYVYALLIKCIYAHYICIILY